MSITNHMEEIEITPSMISRAREKAKDMGTIKGSVRGDIPMELVKEIQYLMLSASNKKRIMKH